MSNFQQKDKINQFNLFFQTSNKFERVLQPNVLHSSGQPPVCNKELATFTDFCSNILPEVVLISDHFQTEPS